MKKCIITAETTCDLTAEMLKENDIRLIPITIILGTEEFKDGVGINTDKLFDYVKKTGELPKTAAITKEEYSEFFKEVKKDCENIIHFSISSKASSTVTAAKKAAEEMENVYVVDTKTLSTGEGLLILKAMDMLSSGMEVKDIYQNILKLVDKVQTSFIVDTLDYLYKGGRCSSAALVGSKILKIHPYIYEKDGELQVKKKYMGNLQRSLAQYVADVANEYKSYDKTRVFVTHSPFENHELVDEVVAKVKELFAFDKVIETEAGATISTHCGKNTLGVLFITE